MLKYLFLSLSFILFITGCAPEYMVKNIYIPPIGKKAKVCIDKCEQKRDICQSRCNTQYNECLNRAFNRAKDIKAILDRHYQVRYNKYLEKLNNYNLKMFDWQNEYDQNYKDWQYFRDKCKTTRDSYACSREYDLRYIIRRYLKTKPKEPKAPHKKSFEQILSNEQKLCINNCSCQKDFDICFLNCGGEIQMKKICIRNCDK